jgi:chromosome segregation ATPase
MDTSWGAGNDYSMILHAVEDNITDVINISDSDNENDDESNNSHGESSCGENEEGNQSIMSNSGNMQMVLQLDNVKLKNEELCDKLRTQKDDFTREKDKYLRQLQFLESEHVSAKKELAARTEKYYDTKKKLQTVVRAADSEKKKLLAQISQLTSQTSASIVSQADKSHRRENKQLKGSTFDEQMTELEDKLMNKSTEVRKLSTYNAQLQEECTTLQQQLLLARSEAGNKEDLSSLRQLQTQVRELEFTLRQKNREYDKLEKSAKNSHILEENLSTCNAKVLSLQESIKTYRSMEVEYNSLVQEKNSWTAQFQDLIHQSDSSDVNDVKSSVVVTPISILRLLSNIQSKCAALLHDKGMLENQISELNNTQRRSALQVQQVELDLTEKNNKVLQLEKSNTLLRQQAKLYEGEVMSLRSLLKTFDAEILIFGNKKKRSRTSMDPDKDKTLTGSSDGGDNSVFTSEVSVLLNLKNQEIENLQRELDQQRTSSATVLKKLMSDVERLGQERYVRPQQRVYVCP